MEDTILTSEKPSNPSPLDPPSRFICHVYVLNLLNLSSSHCDEVVYFSNSISDCVGARNSFHSTRVLDAILAIVLFTAIR